MTSCSRRRVLHDSWRSRPFAFLLREIAEGIESQRLAGETAVPTLLELADVLGLRLGREG